MVPFLCLFPSPFLMNMMSIHARDDDEHDEDHDHKDDDDHSNDDVTVLKNFVVALVYARG